MHLPISAADAVQISELLSKTIADAHARTCFYTLDQIHDGMYRTATMAAANKTTADKLIMYKTMVSCCWVYQCMVLRIYVRPIAFRFMVFTYMATYFNENEVFSCNLLTYPL